MSPILMTTLLHLSEIAKENQTGPVVCCWCNGKNHIKYGTYSRYAFASAELIAIQRYYCKHDRCRRTFSILPHPFLRISRHSLCLLQVLLDLCRQELPIAQIAKRLGLTDGAVVRAFRKALALFSWIGQEAKSDAPWAPTPCMNPPEHWPSFIRMFAAKFYPKRYGDPRPTEYVYC